MTISSSEIKKNMTLIIEGELYQVVEDRIEGVNTED